MKRSSLIPSWLCGTFVLSCAVLFAQEPSQLETTNQPPASPATKPADKPASERTDKSNDKPFDKRADKPVTPAESAAKADVTEPSQISKPAKVVERNPRIILIKRDDDEACMAEITRLQFENGVFDMLKNQKWTIGETGDNHIQIVNVDHDLARDVKSKEYPRIVCIDRGSIVRGFKSGCTTPLDEWTFGWILTGRDDRPDPVLPDDVLVEWTGHYPLRGNHWSFEGEWLPTRETVIEHLRGDHHLDDIPQSWKIETWSFEELRSLHDDVHEAELARDEKALEESTPSTKLQKPQPPIDRKAKRIGQRKQSVTRNVKTRI